MNGQIQPQGLEHLLQKSLLAQQGLQVLSADVELPGGAAGLEVVVSKQLGCHLGSHFRIAGDLGGRLAEECAVQIDDATNGVQFSGLGLLQQIPGQPQGVQPGAAQILQGGHGGQGQVVPVVAVGIQSGQLVELRQGGEVEIEIPGGEIVPALQGQILQGLAHRGGLEVRDVAVFRHVAQDQVTQVAQIRVQLQLNGIGAGDGFGGKSDIHLGPLPGDLVQGIHREDVVHLRPVILVKVLSLLELGQSAVENGELLIDLVDDRLAVNQHGGPLPGIPEHVIAQRLGDVPYRHIGISVFVVAAAVRADRYLRVLLSVSSIKRTQQGAAQRRHLAAQGLHQGLQRHHGIAGPQLRHSIGEGHPLSVHDHAHGLCLCRRFRRVGRHRQGQGQRQGQHQG